MGKKGEDEAETNEAGTREASGGTGDRGPETMAEISENPVVNLFKGLPTRGRALLVMSMKNILYDRKTLIFMGLALFLLVLPGYWAYTWADSDIAGLDLFVIITIMVYIQFIVIYACLLFGASTFTEEEDRKTMTYLLSRPVSKLEIMVHKYIGLVVSVFCLLVVPLLLNFLMISSKVPFEDSWDFMFELGQFVGLMFVAIMAWGALFMFLGVLMKKYALMAGLLYALFWETFLANLPTPIRYGTVNHYIRSLAPSYVSLGGPGPDIASTEWTWALATMVGLAVTMLFLTYMVIREKDYS